MRLSHWGPLLEAASNQPQVITLSIRKITAVIVWEIPVGFLDTLINLGFPMLGKLLLESYG